LPGKVRGSAAPAAKPAPKPSPAAAPSRPKAAAALRNGSGALRKAEATPAEDGWHDF
jgi:hypothetical protein